MPVPGTGSQPELHREHDRQQRTEPEVRHRDADQRHRHRGLIDGRAPRTPPRRCRAESPPAIATTIAATASCDGPRQPRADLAASPACSYRNDVPRSPRDRARRESRGTATSSGRSRPSDARSSRDILGDALSPSIGLRRITRHQVDQREHQRRDAQQHRDRQQQASQQVAQHTPRRISRRRSARSSFARRPHAANGTLVAMRQLAARRVLAATAGRCEGR